MASDRRLEDSISAWLEEAAPGRLPGRVLDATFERTRRSRQQVGWRALLGRTAQMPRFVPALGAAAAVIVAAVLALNNGLIQSPGATPSPAATASSTSPTVQPTALVPVACTTLSESGTVVLDCSRDGTVLLLQKADGSLYVRRADRSETQIAAPGLTNILGSSRPVGATISPDGSRVVFAGLTEPYVEGKSCHNGALFGVSAGGGPAVVLWTSQIPQNGLLNYPTYSPDGTRIAFADGYCDSSHSVWVMNADGSDAHEIGALGAGHVYGLAWSPAGDRIAFDFAGFPDGPDIGNTFALDGSGSTQVNVSGYCWAGKRC